MAAGAKIESAEETGLAERMGFTGANWGWASAGKIALIVILLVWPLLYRGLSDGNYALNVMTQAGLYAILTLSVGLVLGQAGQLSFGHSAFYGIGAYVCGLLVYKFGVPTLAAWVAGAAATGVVALVIGRPVLKLKYFYLALATIGLGQIFLAVVFEVKWVGGSNGFGPIGALNIFGFHFNDQIRKYYMVWVVAIIILLFLSRLLKYRVGRALRGLAVSEIASSTLGVRNTNWKLLAFVFNAVFCGIAGGLFAFVYTAVSPQTFSFSASVLPIVMMLIGGDRSIWGSVVGALIMTWVTNAFSGTLLQYNGTVYSVIMILLLLFLPAGILGFRPEMRRRLWQRIKGETLQEAVACADAVAADRETPSCEPKTMPLPTPESLSAVAVAVVGAPAPPSLGSGVLKEELARMRTESHVEGPLLRI
ncbi:MAG TPA: branched-chain amino acid ABC transporter permease, partial [Thermoleophilia bacterium]|nr:branched-chain amino acid ABC transporter permease [Thermoleophilia bacterium]